MRPARLADITPTILDAAGLAIGARALDGRSLFSRPGGIADLPPFYDRAETLYGWYQFRYARLRASRDPDLKLIEGGGKDELFAYRTDSRETNDLAAEKKNEVARLKRLLLDALTSAPASEATSTFEVPDLAGPYIGGRPAGSALEPTESENEKLARAHDRWNVVSDLENARAAMRRGDPGRAVLMLGAHARELESNPALLFWTARAHHELGEKPDAPDQARLGELDEAAKLYAEVQSRFRDQRGVDSQLLVLRARHKITRAEADLRRLVALADGEIAASGGTALTFALRGVAKRDLGDKSGAIADLGESLRRDPGNPRVAADLAELRGASVPK
jgi:hypothetical protein